MTTQHNWVKPKPSVTVCLAKRQRAKLFVEYSSTRRKKERTVSAESATRDKTGVGMEGKRRQTSNAQRSGKSDGQTGASGKQRATKRENGKDEKETSSG